MEESKQIAVRPKRIAMYVIYDKDGILDNFRKYYLQELRKEVDYIVGVVSGTLTPESRKELEELTDDFFVRENVGLLAYSWIDGIAHIGWDTLEEYDELLMLNDSFFGPFYPLKDMFDACENSDADFYGAMKNMEDEEITRIERRELKHGHFRGSICYFYIIKSRLLHSTEFKKYWSSKPNIIGDWDTYFFSEIDFFDYVIDAGFKIDAYQGDKLKYYFFNNLTHNMKMLVADEKIPFARARAMASDLKSECLQVNYGSDPRDTIDYIDKHTDYDVKMIWDYLLRTKNLTDLWHQMQLQYVVPKASLDRPFIYNKKIAVILHVSKGEYVDLLADYCENFAGLADFYITANSDKICRQIVSAFQHRDLLCKCTIRLDKGNAISTLWVTYANVVLDNNYEYICYFHDVADQDKIVKERLANRCYQNLIGTEHIIKNIINIFEEHPSLGILGAPTPYHGEYYLSNVRSQYVNYKGIKDLVEKLDLHVNLNPDKTPVSTYGDMFWFRSAALKKVISKKYSYEEINKMELEKGYVYSIIECCYGYIAQDSGYYFANVINTDEARNDLSNYQYMVEQMGMIMMQNGHYPYNFYATETILRSYYGHVHSYRHVVKAIIKKCCPKFVWNIGKKIYHFFGGTKWLD